MNPDKIDMIYDFGKNVIVKARDMTINSCFEIVDGISRVPSCIGLQNTILDLNNEQKDIIKKIIIRSIDGAINNFIWMMEQNNDKYAFVAKDDDGSHLDIEQESDGLCMGQWEFIDEYSDYNDMLKVLQTGEIEKTPKKP